MGCEASHGVMVDWYAQKRGKCDDVITSGQVEVILRTWPLLNADKMNTGCKIFTHMFSNAPEVKQSFSFRNLEGEQLYKNVVFRAHGTNFMTLIGDVVENINSLDIAATKRLMPLGAKHVLINAFNPSYLKIFKQSVMYTWENMLGNKYTADVHEAWTAVFDFMIENVADGYREFEKEQDRRTMTNGAPPPIRKIEEYTG